MKRQITPLNDEQRKMIEDNLPFVTYVAKKYFGKDQLKNEDIIQEGIYAMIKALPNYDEERAKFSTYMYPTIDGHLKRFARYRDRLIPIPHQKHLKQATVDKAENAKLVLSLDLKYKTNFGEDDNCTLMNTIKDEVIMEEETTNKLALNKAIKTLEWREKIVISYRYYFDLDQTHIGRLMGISQVHCHRIEKKALEKMRKFLSK